MKRASQSSTYTHSEADVPQVEVKLYGEGVRSYGEYCNGIVALGQILGRIKSEA